MQKICGVRTLPAELPVNGFQSGICNNLHILQRLAVGFIAIAMVLSAFISSFQSPDQWLFGRTMRLNAPARRSPSIDIKNFFTTFIAV